VIEGGHPLTAATMKAVDLRAGAAMVIAGLAVPGQSVITDIHLIERGFEDIVGKLQKLGAVIRRSYRPDEDFIQGKAN
ncbi:MAG: UDP-N-acetylglucosamine 1-carboxyvinyltransferase, partial [Clostridia bacterium]|nr:UDP-N-acetylglucosamine 1-carboxyvinyltransferase [Clostridia bacterium]